MPHQTTACLICGNTRLAPVLSLGEQALTGVFPSSTDQNITRGPLDLVKCVEDQGEACGLLQLGHLYDLNEMYGMNYGYRSGLNALMVAHLRDLVEQCQSRVSLNSGDWVLDIGSNDGTLLSHYDTKGLNRLGIDPTGVKFSQYYPEGVDLISELFSADLMLQHCGGQRAKIITTISMLYDLEDPMGFVKQVHDCLDDEGIWMSEQVYMPHMIEQLLYDTICHEHLQYYGLQQINWMFSRNGLKIIDVNFNDTNGASFCVLAARATSSHAVNQKTVTAVLDEEHRREFNTLRPYRLFKEKIEKHREELIAFLREAKARNKKTFGYGASTKGNVILQYCNLTAADIPCIAEVNPDKFGRTTPGTGIPIVSETEAHAMNPDYFLVFPWHFKKIIVEREQEFLNRGGALVMPLPKIDIIRRQTLSLGASRRCLNNPIR